MKSIGIWLYRYMAIHVDYLLYHVLAPLDAMMPTPCVQASSPACQDARVP